MAAISSGEKPVAPGSSFGDITPPLVWTLTWSAQVHVTVDHAGHDGQVLRVNDLGIAREVAAALHANNGFVFDHERDAADRLGACAVDQRAATYCCCHGRDLPGTTRPREASQHSSVCSTTGNS